LLVAAPLLLVVALVLFSLGSVMARRTAGVGPSEVNGPGSLGELRVRVAPEFTLPLYSGSAVSMADLRGRGVVVNFWGSWCVPCRDEAPVLSRLAKEYESQGVTFVGIAVWDNEREARSFISRYSMTYPAGPDDSGKVAVDFGLGGVPETFFVRPDGTLARRWVGALNESQLRSLVEEIRPGPTIAS